MPLESNTVLAFCSLKAVKYLFIRNDAVQKAQIHFTNFIFEKLFVFATLLSTFDANAQAVSAG